MHRASSLDEMMVRSRVDFCQEEFALGCDAQLGTSQVSTAAKGGAMLEKLGMVHHSSRPLLAGLLGRERETWPTADWCIRCASVAPILPAGH